MNVVNHVFTIILVIKIHVQHWAWIYIVSFLNIKRYHLILFCLDLNSVWCVFDAINETDKQIISCGLHSQDNWTVSGWNVTVTRHRTVDIYIYISTDSCKHRPHFLINDYTGFKSPPHTYHFIILTCGPLYCLYYYFLVSTCCYVQ